MTIFGKLEEELGKKRLPFPWEMTRKGFEDYWLSGKNFSFPVEWLRDHRFLNSDPARGITIRQRDLSSRPQEYIDKLKASVEKEGMRDESPPSINMYKDGTFGLSDGTHRVLVASELGHTYIPVEFTPNFVDFGGYDVVTKRAILKGINVPKEVSDQFKEMD